MTHGAVREARPGGHTVAVDCARSAHPVTWIEPPQRAGAASREGRERSVTMAGRLGQVGKVSVIALAAVACLWGAAGAGEPVKVTYVFSWAPDARWTGEFLAKERGYYKAEGLDVNFTNQRGSLAALQQVAAGAAEFGSPDGGDVVFGHEKGLPVRSVILTARNTAVAFMSLKETNITKPEDLVGKKVGVQRASATWVGFQALMGAHHVDIEKLEKIEAAFGLDVLLLKKVDIRPVMLFNEYVLAEHKGIPVNVLWLPDFGINMVGKTIATNEKTLKERPQVVQAFVNASLRGIEEAIKDRKAAIDALMKNVPDLERAYQEKVWNMLVDRLMGLKDNTKERPYGYNDPDLFKATIEVVAKYGGLKKALTLDEIYDNRFVEAYHRAKR
jgi:NitT/TauT family transport system substrate-binding protein